MDYEPPVEWVDRAHSRFVSGLSAKIDRDREAGAAPSGIDATTLAEMVSDLRDAKFPHIAKLENAAFDQAIDNLTEVVLRMLCGKL